MKIGIDGKPIGLSARQKIERQCYLIEKYWHDLGFENIFAEPMKDKNDNWKIFTNARATVKCQ